jgi:purine nucleosidase
MGAREKIIIDTDPGQDDAVAILLALASPEEIEVLGITTVAGNVELAHTTRNALKIVELAGRHEVPVFAGCARPMLRPLETAKLICGEDGLAGAALPPPRLAAQRRHAVDFIVDTVMAAGDGEVTLCPVGPLTNIALAIVKEPRIVPKLRRVVLMGGAQELGNVTPSAEFNFFVDPHAAHVVLTAGAPIVMFGLHATHQALATPPRLGAITRLGSPVARAVTGMLSRHRPDAIEKFGGPGHPLHDPCVIAYLLWPELFQGRDCHVAIELESREAIGRSTIDWWNRLRRPANAHVVGRIDADGFFARLTERLGRL